MSEAFNWSNSIVTGLPKYKCKYNWPADCSRLQCGGNGSVFKSKDFTKIIRGEKITPIYKTAYFESFPETPISTFIRGEGTTIEEAEEDAWKQWQKILVCSTHDLYSRGYADYSNGYRICKKCGVGLSCRPKYKQYITHQEWLRVHGGLTQDKEGKFIIINPTRTIQELIYVKK